ncbi:laminin subunit beta-1-like [Notechis scutatus]|uniref:Laminin subunit beta-1-like n=1 Tax=Notechis scutatus TaxID=8663 RepID=A0A6J1VEY6_9SAUR|nr:laminin subunit beta-1-like [Notechis scutatus]
MPEESVPIPKLIFVWMCPENVDVTFLKRQPLIMLCDFLFSQAVSQLETLLNKELRLERRLKGLAQDVATLQKKSQDNQRQAQQATGKAERATNIALQLKNEVDEVKQNYQKLQDELEKQPKDVLLRLKNLREEAQNLLDKANSSKRKLEELEKRFGDNEREMTSKTEELQKLEATALGLLQSIQEHAIAYATC